MGFDIIEISTIIAPVDKRNPQHVRLEQRAMRMHTVQGTLNTHGKRIKLPLYHSFGDSIIIYRLYNYIQGIAVHSVSTLCKSQNK